MAGRNLPSLVAHLVGPVGLPVATPALVVQWAATPRQRSWAGSLGQIRDLVLRDLRREAAGGGGEGGGAAQQGRGEGRGDGGGGDDGDDNNDLFGRLSPAVFVVGGLLLHDHPLRRAARR